MNRYAMRITERKIERESERVREKLEAYTRTESEKQIS